MSEDINYRYTDSDGVTLELFEGSGGEDPFIEITASLDYPYTSVFVPQGHAFEILKRLSRTIRGYNVKLPIDENFEALSESIALRGVMQEFGLDGIKLHELTVLEQKLIQSIVDKRSSDV